MPARIMIETAEQHAAWMAAEFDPGRRFGHGALVGGGSRWRPPPLRIPHSHGHAHHAPGFVEKYLWSTDHKMIAMQYMFTGMAMALIGGFFAYVFRMQIAFPGVDVPGFGVVSPNEYNRLITNHGTIMIFWVAMPVLIAAFGNFLIPLMIGCDDMVFPKLNRLSYQIFLLSAIVLIVVVLRARWRLRGRLDDVPAALGQAGVQPDAARLDALRGRGRARVRGLPDGRHQLRHHRDELARARHAHVRHPDRGLDDRGREHPVHGCRWGR